MKLRRSPRELAYRLRQELRNIALLLRPPKLLKTAAAQSPRDTFDLSLFTGPISDSEILELAPQIRAHRFPLFGTILETGPDIAWRRDYSRNVETPLSYFRLIPFLDASRAGDHKLIWELNRHQHLVVLAQAFRISGDSANLDEIVAQVKSWIEANPFQRGINWASALEVAFRALSWIWVDQLVGVQFPPEFRKVLHENLNLHGSHLENNLSFYFSPNTHLLGEAVALHAIGHIYPQFQRAPRWRDLGRRVVLGQMNRQVRADGSHLEQSTYYHVYALDMFRYHATLEAPPPDYDNKLEKMREFLACIMGPAQRLPFIGDDDGGRFCHPYGRRDEFGRASNVGLRTASRQSRLFPESGLAVMTVEAVHIVINAGPFGPWGSGHSHSDTLSVTARIGDEDILIDPGTYTYVGDLSERNWFRGSAAHNTIRINGRDQAVAAGPFRWTRQPQVRIVSWTSTETEDFLDVKCAYAGFTQRRQFRFDKPDRVLYMTDEITGLPGNHEIEQFWHLGSEAARARIVCSGTVESIDSWASSVFGEKHRSPALRIALRTPCPIKLNAAVLFCDAARIQETKALICSSFRTKSPNVSASISSASGSIPSSLET